MKFFFLYLFILLSFQKSYSSQESTTIFSDKIMTVPYRIIIGQSLNNTQRHQVQKTIDIAFEEIDSIYNKWNPASELSQLNRLKAYENKILSLQLYNFFERINYFVDLSNGLLDPTIEPLQQLWNRYLIKGSMPSDEEIESLKPCLGWNKVHFANGVFYKDDSRTQIDLGGIAKGLAVDLIVIRLKESGFKNCYIEWGGEIRTSGEHPEHRPWKIFISRMGSANPADAIATVNIINQAIATSGDYYQFWQVTTPSGEKRTYTHIYNPLTLSPIQVKAGGISSTSLMADNCLTADSLAKVLMLFESSTEAEEWISQVQKKIPHLRYWIQKRQSYPHTN